MAEYVEKRPRTVKMFIKWGMEMPLMNFIAFWVGLILGIIFYTLPFFISPLEVDVLSFSLGTVSTLFSMISLMETATRSDIAMLRGDLAALRGDIAALREEISRGFEEVGRLLRQVLEELRRR